MICVTGAGGTVSSELIKNLVSAKVSFRAAYFSEKKAEAARAKSIDAVIMDYNNPEMLRPLSMVDDKGDDLHQSAWDALSELLMWKLKTRDDNDLKLNERFLAKSLKLHLIPLLLPGEGSPSISHKNLEVFSKLVAAVVNRNNFLHRTIFEFCLDDDYRYKFDGKQLTLYPIEIPEESEWDFNGRKLSALHRYWFNRAVIIYFNSDLPNQQSGLPENDVSNRLAHIKATQVYLQLEEIYGMDPEISLPDGTQVSLLRRYILLNS